MPEKKIYQKTTVVVSEKDLNPESKLYSSEVETNFYKTLPFTLEVYEKPQVKEWDWGKWVIIWQLNIANKQVGIRERENNYGKQYAGTIIKGEFFVNVDQVLARGSVPSYEVKFIERDFDAEKTDSEENSDVPF